MTKTKQKHPFFALISHVERETLLKIEEYVAQLNQLHRIN